MGAVSVTEAMNMAITVKYCIVARVDEDSDIKGNLLSWIVYHPLAARRLFIYKSDFWYIINDRSF